MEIGIKNSQNPFRVLKYKAVLVWNNADFSLELGSFFVSFRHLQVWNMMVISTCKQKKESFWTVYRSRNKSRFYAVRKEG